MPIVKRNPAKPQTPAPNPVIAKEDYKSIAVDTRYQPKETILAHIEGSSWTVDYYSQVLGQDTGISGQELGLDPTLQQYKLISGMEMKVSSASTTTQDNDTKDLTDQGAATLYPFIIPNKGDMFVADLLDGRRGVFKVTNSTRLSIFREACHSIDYELVDYGSDTYLDDLKRKTVQTTYFEKDFIYHGQNPVLVSDDYESLQFLRRQYGVLITQYFKRFYSKEYGTLIMPDQSSIVYDAFLVRALFQHLSTWDARELTILRQLNCDDDQVMTADSIWSAIVERSRTVLNDAFQQVGYVSSSSFTQNPMYEGIRYSGIEQVIYPIDPMVRVDNQQTQNVKAAGEFIPVRLPNRRSLASLITATQEDQSKIGIKDTFENGYYVFSKAFYDNDRTEGAQSKLELCMQDYFDQKEISYARLRELVEASTQWDAVNSFYYVPVLIILIKAVIRAI